MTQAYALKGMRSLGDFRTMWNQGNSVGRDDSILAHQTMAHIYPEGELQVELIEKMDAYWFIADLPNIQQDDVTIQVSGEVLSIVGEWPEEATARDAAPLVRPYRMFARQFRLEEPVEAETISTTYTDGLLAVCVPKLAPSQAESPSLELVES
jgi:HSP20 family protein